MLTAVGRSRCPRLAAVGPRPGSLSSDTGGGDGREFLATAPAARLGTPGAPLTALRRHDRLRAPALAQVRRTGRLLLPGRARPAPDKPREKPRGLRIID